MSDIGTWSHEAVSKATIPSGEDPAVGDGWNDNLAQIKTAVNSKLDKSGTVTSFPTVGADVPIGPEGTATALTNYDSYDLYISGSFWDGAAAKYRRFLARTAVDASEYYLEIASRAEGSAETSRWELVSDGTIRPTTNDTGSLGSSAKRWGDVFVTNLDASEVGNHLIPATNITWDLGSTTGPKRFRKIWAQDVDLSGTTQTIGTVTSGVWQGTAVAVGYGGTGLAVGTSGGVLGFTGTTTLASSVLLTANALVLGGGAGATPTPLGSLGTTTTILHGNAAGAPTWAAVSLTADVSGTLPVANGGTGLTAGTSGGVLAYSATGTIVSSALLTANALVLGGGAGVAPSALGSLGTTTTLLHGNASGAPTFAAVSLTADVSGILPTANGGTGIAYFTAAGPSVARVYTFPDAACSILTTNAAVTVAQGGTGLAVGTSGGILGFTGTTTLASSVLLTANALVLGGGAGATPTPLGSLGTTTTVLHGNAAGAPTFAAVSLTADVSGILPTANGGTGIAYFTAAGPSVARVYTFPDAACSVLTTNAAVTAVQGGTGLTTYTLGDVLYSSAANTLSALAGNTTTTKKFLRQTGTGAVSVAPAWDTVTSSDVGLGSVENTALSTWAGTTNITTLGTITAGTWNAGAITSSGNLDINGAGPHEITGNLGLGVTPEAWGAHTAFQIGELGAIWANPDGTGAGSGVSLSANVEYNSVAGDMIRIITDEASWYQQINGTHVFKVVASGAADAAITWITGLSIAATGYVQAYNGSGLSDVLVGSATKTTAAAPYTNDGYITVQIGGSSVRLMTTA